MPTFVGVVDEEERAGSGPGWHIQLRAGHQDLHWCIVTGAQVLIMPKHPSLSSLLVTDKTLIGAGEAALDTVGPIRGHSGHRARHKLEKLVARSGQ